MSSKPLLRHLVSAGLLVSGGILLGRLTGFLREVVVASKFGVSQDADIVLFSLILPDFLIICQTKTYEIFWTKKVANIFLMPVLAILQPCAVSGASLCFTLN